jgi:tetratricopeptide (TPR) repeat protein
MNFVFAALLLQTFFMPPRLALENPAVISPLPQQYKKDYDKLWVKFLTAKEDPKILKDADKLLKKQKDLESVLMLEAYIDLYANRRPDAERKLEAVLAKAPQHRIALSYLAELSFARQDYARAGALYAKLLTVDRTRTDVEPKYQKAVLLATETLLRNAARAEADNRVSDAEAMYREALRIAPNEPVLHAELGALLLREKKWEDAMNEFRRQLELDRSNDEAQRHLAEALMNLGRTEESRVILSRLRETGVGDELLETKVKELEDLGRWGGDIDQFRRIESSEAISREGLAAIFVRYFPQLTEFRQTPQIVTDLQNSWASLEIQTIVGVGLMDPLPNHTFQPSVNVTRGEVAVAIARLSRLLGLPATSTVAIPVSDVSSGNPLSSDVRLVVSLGLLKLDDQGRFNINEVVSGKEAVNCAEQLLELLKEKTG